MSVFYYVWRGIVYLSDGEKLEFTRRFFVEARNKADADQKKEVKLNNLFKEMDAKHPGRLVDKGCNFSFSSYAPISEEVA